MPINRQEGSDNHGYTDAQKYAIEREVSLVQRIQKHMISTYTKYIKNLQVRKDAEENKKVKGAKTGALGGPSI
eukprot:7564216-Heterocapsa_arctica.AAC.1